VHKHRLHCNNYAAYHLYHTTFQTIIAKLQQIKADYFKEVTASEDVLCENSLDSKAVYGMTNTAIRQTCTEQDEPATHWHTYQH